MVNKGRWNKLVKFVVYAASVSLVVLSLIFAFVIFQPVKVIKSWTLTTTEMTYRSGADITLISKINKVMNVTGQSNRYVVCVTNNTEERFTINSALANRPTGSRSTTVTFTLPSDITNLPRTCHVNFTVVYSIYRGIRTDTEVVNSNNFTITP